MNHEPESMLKTLNATLDRMEKDIAQAEEIVKQENPYAEKVKTLSDRLNQLNREIAETLVEDGRQKAAEAPAEEKAEEKLSSNRKYSLDNSDNRRYSVSRITDTQKDELFRQVSSHLSSYIDEQVAKGKDLADLLEELASEHSSHREKLLGGYRATARDFEVRKDDKEHRQTVVEAHWPGAKTWTENREAKIKEAYDLFTSQIKEVVDYAGVLYREIVIDRERASRNPERGVQLHSWRDAERQRSEREAGTQKNSIRPTSRSEESGFSIARSMDELKAEVIEAFPGSKVQEQGNKLIFTMPNGQKVTFTFHESITVSDDELARAKREHGIDQRVTVTVEGYAESVGGEGFGALSQVSRKGTGFHEAYHIAEAIAFTKKELADANRLISENEEERANAYAKWKMDRKQYSNFAKLWQKIADVAAKMAGLLGYETKRNLFRKVESGEIYERNNKSGKDLARKYSVNPSDNSSESLAHRIKNLLSGQKPEEYRHRKMMADLLGKALKITIRGGKIADRKGNVIYKANDRVLRSKHMYDWENILPVAGGIIAEQLGIVKEAKQTSEAMKNYIADWILTGAPNNTSKEAKEFQKGMQRNPHLADKLQDVRNEFEKWNSMGAKEQMRASIQMTKQTKTNWRDVKNYLHDQLYEELGPIDRMVEEIQGEMKKMGKKLSYSVNPMIAFRLARGAHGRAITMIEGRGKAAVNALKKNFPNVDFTGFKTLYDILKSIGAYAPRAWG